MIAKKSNLDFGIATGLDNNFAIQYNNYNAKSKDTTLSDGFGGTFQENGGLKTQELNVLYKIDKNVSIYTGVVRVKGNVTSDGDSFSSNTKNKIQFGLVGSTKIADKTTAYAQVGVASDFTNWKVGLSQEMALDYYFAEKVKIVIVGCADNADTQEMLNAIHNIFLPNAAVRFYDISQEDTGGYKAVKGKTTAYVCKNFTCEPPTTDVAKLVSLFTSK